MRSSHSLDRLDTAFDDDRLWTRSTCPSRNSNQPSWNRDSSLEATCESHSAVDIGLVRRGDHASRSPRGDPRGRTDTRRNSGWLDRDDRHDTRWRDLSHQEPCRAVFRYGKLVCWRRERLGGCRGWVLGRHVGRVSEQSARPEDLGVQAQDELVLGRRPYGHGDTPGGPLGVGLPCWLVLRDLGRGSEMVGGESHLIPKFLPRTLHGTVLAIWV